MARQSLSPMRDYIENHAASVENRDRVGRKRKDAPITHLKYLRKRSGYTLEALSEITSISISYLSRLESGSRRLNTDLIKRLSHAFGCEPADLLQEISHENRVVTPIEFNRKKRTDISYRDNGIPLYSITNDDNDPNKLIIKMCSPTEWKLRPSELMAKAEVFAVKAESFFKPHFSESSVLYMEPANNNSLSPESLVVILDRGEILIKKVWSVTPTSLQLCDMCDIDALKKGGSQNKLWEVSRDSVDMTYKVVGYSDFDLA